MSEEQQTHIADALSAGAALTDVKRLYGEPGGNVGAPFIVVPAGYKHVDLTPFLPAPIRRKGRAVLSDLESFIRLVNQERVPGNTRIYAVTAPAPKFTAVFDDRSWGEHSAAYECPLSAEWKLWIGGDGTHRNQESFVKLVEDNLLDIIDPQSADLLEIMQRFEARKTAQFVKGTKLQDGTTEFVYVETIEATAGRAAEPGGKGSFTVPERFTLGIPVFHGGQRWSVHAKLRYRIKEGTLTLWYDLEHPERVLEEAVADVRAAIEAPRDATPPGTGEKVFLGAR